jgi:DNA polymerase (family X)
MPDPTNTEIAAAFDELGDLYELDGAVVHRVLAYRTGAKAVRDASTSVAELARQGRATELPGIGATLQDKINALTETGEIPALVKLHGKFPPGLVQMTHLEGLGPKRARRLFEELQLDSLEKLQAAAQAGQIRELKGFGPKAEDAILKSLLAYHATGPQARVPLSQALAAGEELRDAIRACEACEQAELAGSARRWAETVKDLDIVATSTAPGELARAVAELPLVESASTPGENAVKIRTHTGMSVDVRIVEPDQFGNVLQHLTGSKDHNRLLREYAAPRGIHISEYGVTIDETGQTHRCATEEQVYELIGMDYVEPELRENRGEIEAALKHRLPHLIEVSDLKGDLHAHTTASDGTASIEEMAQAAQRHGYEYLAITDHSASMGFGADVSPSELGRQIERIRSTDVPGIELLAGSEVNILPDGSLDYEDELLGELDWVVASVHSAMKMDSEAMTARIISAIENPYVDCIGHLTGRRLGQREPYALDFEAIVAACTRTGTMLEINSSPSRRDLNEVHARAAIAAGVRVVITTDSHRTDGFAVNRYGVATARRAWLSAEQIENCRPWSELSQLRKRAAAAS